ncbi:unnamed protein product [Amaranthus hypochondriacus]
MSTPISQKSQSYSYTIPITIFFLVISFLITKIESRNLDEVLESSDPSIKCGGCSPCGHPSCYSPPPPPPPSPPPPKKQSGTTPYCPPPPPSPPSGAGFVYITAPPGDLYPVDVNYSASYKNLVAAINIFIGFIGFLIV